MREATAFRLFLAIAAALQCAIAMSFEIDAVRRAAPPLATHESVHNALLSGAVPLAEYEAGLHETGFRIQRNLQGDDEEEERTWEEESETENDDYYIVSDYLYNFTGYSLKYGKCQTVQRFSEEALQSGEYSSMVTDDLIILRLCPQESCSSNKQYGCHYDYVEYAIGLGDYLRIMIKHSLDKRRKLCSFCEKCGYIGGRRNEEQDATQDDYYAQNGDSSGSEDSSQPNNGYRHCSSYEETCYSIGSWCDGEQNDDDGSYLDVVDFLDYLDCVQVQGQGSFGGGQTWVRPYCDPYSSTIKMAPFYDQYCSQYAGDDINLEQFTGIYFQTSVLENYYSDSCMDCSDSNDPPYYTANSLMCNNVHQSSAACKSNTMYDLFNSDATDDSTECNFIESLQVGTYNEKGEIYDVNDSNIPQQVTDGQKLGIVLLAVAALGLGIYSCFLHRTITNLLIQSLNHGQLLPPSRHRRAPKTVTKKKSTLNDAEDDWDHSAGAFA